MKSAITFTFSWLVDDKTEPLSESPSLRSVVVLLACLPYCVVTAPRELCTAAVWLGLTRKRYDFSILCPYWDKQVQNRWVGVFLTQPSVTAANTICIGRELIQLEEHLVHSHQVYILVCGRSASRGARMCATSGGAARSAATLILVLLK